MFYIEVKKKAYKSLPPKKAFTYFKGARQFI
jgi:hypothetical protein